MKRTKNLKNQRGSALLLTLGILSLVMIMAMSFAFSARTTRQVAKVNADQVKARLLAESALERVLAAMKHAYQDLSTPPVSRPYPPQTTLPSMNFTSSGGQGHIFSSDGSTPTPEEVNDFSEQIPYSSAVSDEIYFLPILRHITPAAPQPTFQKVGIDLNSDGDINDSDEVTGRIAFLLLEEANKLDVNQMLSLNSTVPFVQSGQDRLAPFSETYASATDFLYTILGTGVTSISFDANNSYEGNTLRLGLNMQEMQLPYEYFTYLPPGYTGTKAQWFSYAHLWKTKWATSPGDELKYTFFSGEDIEAYWDQASENATVGTGERQRFDVTGWEWRCQTIANSTGWQHPDSAATASAKADYARSLVTALTGTTLRPQFFSGTTPAAVAPVEDISSVMTFPSNFGIPYLQGLATKDQIAANMVDFCDNDNAATYFPSTYSLDSISSPDYFGNEGVLYFNEVVAKVVAYKTPNATDPLSSDYSLEVVLYPEMLNIFAIDKPVGRIRIRLVGGAQINVGGAGYVDLPSFNSTVPLDFTWSKPSPDAKSLGFYLPSNVVMPLGTQTVLDTTSVSVKFQVTRIVMISDDDVSSRFYDTGYCDSPCSVEIDAKSYADAPGYPVCISWEVGDIRLNHKSTSWTVRVCEAGQDELYATTPNCPTLDAVNLHFAAELASSVSPDVEDYVGMDFSTAVKTFSTAFIADLPFRSLWELGAIHRGEKFRTINIADVDKAILDQVKIGPLKRTRGKFNLHSLNPAAIEELLGNINVSTSYDAVTSGEAATVTAAPGSLPATLTSSRGDFADVLKYSTGTNDRAQEALIGRTANLLTTRMDKYSILVVGQALKGLDGVTATTWPDVQKTVVNPIEYPTGSNYYYSILGTQRILAHIVRDAWRNEYKIVQMQLLED